MKRAVSTCKRLMATAACSAMLALLLTGCSTGNAPASSESVGGSNEAGEERPLLRDSAASRVVPDAPDSSGEDEQALVCEPVSQNLLDAMRSQFGTPARAVQVEVGEGLEPGENWWIVVLDSPADDAYKWGIRAFLTNAPGVSSKDEWKWIIIDIDSDDPWRNVSWDGQRLARAQSALDVALDYLDASSHE